MNIRLWGILVILLAGLGGVSWYLSHQQTTAQKASLKMPSSEELNQTTPSPATPAIKKATKEPGRVVVLDTVRGRIEFVLYEKDCPKTTARISDLVQKGGYNGVTFPRVEDWVIQITPANKVVAPMGVEIVDGLTQTRGTVGMARASDPNSNTSVFYILLQPAPHLDSGYTNFGRVIKGMDVADKMRIGDKIRKATIRSLTSADKAALKKLLKSDEGQTKVAPAS